MTRNLKYHGRIMINQNMSYELNSEEELYRWERDHDYRIVWLCPQCCYSYESAPDVNEARRCPDCGCRTENAGESYQG